MTINHKENQLYQVDTPKRDTIIAIIYSGAIFSFFTILFVLQNKGATPVTTYDLSNITSNILVYGLFFYIPISFLIIKRKQIFATAGVQRYGLTSSLLSGLFFLCIIMWGFDMMSLAVLVAPVLLIYWWQSESLNRSKFLKRLSDYFQHPSVPWIIFSVSIIGIMGYILTGGTIDTGESIISKSAMYGIISTLIQTGAEEYAYRGYFQTRSVTWLGERKGILLSSAVFTMMHTVMLIYLVIDADLSLLIVPINLFFMFLWILVVGYMVYRTNNLSVAILMHFAVNFF